MDSIQETYELIKDIKTKDEFEKEIEKRYFEYNELLSKESIALLIVDKLGRNKGSVKKISEIKNNEPATIFAEVKKIEVNNEGANLEIFDDTESCFLNLQEDDLKLVREGKIKEKTKLKIVNGFVKDDKFKEISIGRWGLLIIEPNDYPLIKKVEKKEEEFVNLEDLKESKSVNVKGNIAEKGRLIKFKKDGKEGKVYTIEIFDGTSQTKVVFWGRRTEIAENLDIGDEIVIKSAIAKLKNEKIELHIGEKTTVERIE